MFKHTYNARYGDYRDLETMKIGSVMDLIQDISTKSSEESGYGISTLKEMKLAWLLKGTNIRFEASVDPREPIEAYTAVKPPRGATSNRGCMMYQNGVLKVKSIADWFLFDTSLQKPVRIPPEIAKAYDVYDFDDEFFKYQKPPIIENAKELYTIRVANKDIDTNMHLNNQRGADLMMDALPFDFRIRDIRIIYKKPCFLGDELTICLEEIENGYYVHTLGSDGEIHTAASFTK